MLGKCFTTELYSQSFNKIMWWVEQQWPQWTHRFEFLATGEWHYLIEIRRSSLLGVGVDLLEEECHQEVAFALSRAQNRPISLSLSLPPPTFCSRYRTLSYSLVPCLDALMFSAIMTVVMGSLHSNRALTNTEISTRD